MKRMYKVRVGYLALVEADDNFDALREATFPLYGKDDIHNLSASVVHAEPIPTEAQAPKVVDVAALPSVEDSPF